MKQNKYINKVIFFLNTKGYITDILELESSTRTAQDAANTIGCEVAQIAKTIVFIEENSEKPIIVIASGSNRINTNKIKESTGLILKKADAEYIISETGCVIGGVPPVGHNNKMLTFLDNDLKKHNLLWVAAGTSLSVFKLTPTDLALLTDGTWLDLSE